MGGGALLHVGDELRLGVAAAELAQPLVDERRLRRAAAGRVDHERDRPAARGAEGAREDGVEALQVDELAVAPCGGEAAVAHEGRVQEHVRREARLVRVKGER